MHVNGPFKGLDEALTLLRVKREKRGSSRRRLLTKNGDVSAGRFFGSGMHAVLQWRNLTGLQMHVRTSYDKLRLDRSDDRHDGVERFRNPFSPPDPDQTRLDRLHPINKGNNPTTALDLAGGFALVTSTKDLQPRESRQFWVCFIGCQRMDVTNGKTGVSAAPVSVDQYFHEGEVVADGLSMHFGSVNVNLCIRKEDVVLKVRTSSSLSDVLNRRRQTKLALQLSVGLAPHS
ncbi:hypothetical protein ROHU_031825 [Labeo rohita]|uniref:Uncharacterized protein n=1 Tax=Labeo rohita TaxID=84645 RepID=A0A498LLI1_LABRO|nr:hypothetical protein ROHU_031825 [Labeo rohita]